MHKKYGDEGEEGYEEEEEQEMTVPEFQKDEIIPLLQANNKSNLSTKVATATAMPCWANLGIKEKMTTPPTHLTESELISKMEKNGIGTDASIAVHVNNIQQRNYTSLETGRRLVPTKLGLVLVQGYHLIDSGLVLPKIRSGIEDQCSRIAKGLARKVSDTRVVPIIDLDCIVIVFVFVVCNMVSHQRVLTILHPSHRSIPPCWLAAGIHEG